MKQIELYELKPLDLRFTDDWKNTYKLFGFRSWLCLASPLLNFVMNFKYRSYELTGLWPLARNPRGLHVVKDEKNED